MPVSDANRPFHPRNLSDTQPVGRGIDCQQDEKRGDMTTQIPLTLACGDYDRTRAIKDGRVQVEGCALTYLPLEPEEIFHRAFRHQEFDACELSFSSYLRTVDAG